MFVRVCVCVCVFVCLFVCVCVKKAEKEINPNTRIFLDYSIFLLSLYCRTLGHIYFNIYIYIYIYIDR